MGCKNDIFLYIPLITLLVNVFGILTMNSPNWSGAGETMHPIYIPECYNDKFEVAFHEEYKLNVHFTKESWNGRMKACRGVGASLTIYFILEVSESN